jgi:hypothetical protein
MGKGCAVDYELAEKLHGLRFFQTQGLDVARSWTRPLCDCGYEGKLVCLYGDAIHAYCSWWEGGLGPPPVDV